MEKALGLLSASMMMLGSLILALGLFQAEVVARVLPFSGADAPEMALVASLTLGLVLVIVGAVMGEEEDEYY